MTAATATAVPVSPAAPAVVVSRDMLALFASDSAKLRAADKATKRAAVAVAEIAIFGIFGDVNTERDDRRDAIAGGVLAGKAIASVLRAVYGSDNVRPGVLTADQIGTTFGMANITIKSEKATGVSFATAALVKLVSDRKASLKKAADAQRELYHVTDGESTRVHSDADIDTALTESLAKLDKAAAVARAYITDTLPLVPDAMRIIRTAHNGTVKRADGSTLPVDVAFARVLMNVTDKAIDVADSVVRFKGK